MNATTADAFYKESVHFTVLTLITCRLNGLLFVICAASSISSVNKRKTKGLMIFSADSAYVLRATVFNCSKKNGRSNYCSSEFSDSHIN